MGRLVLWHRLLVTEDGNGAEHEGIRPWLDRVFVRFTSAGGGVLTGAGGTLVFQFDPAQLEAALDTALALLREAEQHEPPVLCTIAATTGAVQKNQSRWGAHPLGSALDRAQLLANRSKPGELVLDRSTESSAGAVYLFERVVPTGSGALRGRAVDRAHPRRSACRPAIRALAPPDIPAGLRAPLQRLDELASTLSGVDRVLLRGPLGMGAHEWLRALIREQPPSFVLELEPVPSALEPLGSLRLALLGTHPGLQPVLARLSSPQRGTLATIALGRPVSRAAAVDALRALLGGAPERRPWLLADIATSIDPSTMALLGEVLADDGPASLFVARLPLDAQAPPALLEAGLLEELHLPKMQSQDAFQVARSVLGADTPEEVLRRVAVLGASSPLAVLEAARTLTSAGDLIHDGAAFRWRMGPRQSAGAVAVDALIGERLKNLETLAQQVLELVCAAPRLSARATISAAALEDGLSAGDVDEALRVLTADAFLDAGDPLRTSSELLRAVVLRKTEAKRLRRLHQLVAGALEASLPADAHFARATLGFHLGEAGEGDAAARAFVVAGQHAALQGFARAALRLAAAAVQYDASRATQTEASQLSRLLRSGGPGSARPSHAPAAGAAPTLARRAVRAILSRDLDGLEELVDTAIAEGRDRAAAERLRALGHLARGDVTNAMQTLAVSQQHEGERADTAARGALTRSVLLLRVGDRHEAVRAALQTLAHARRTQQRRGEAAALRVLGDCFEALGQSEAAAKLRARLDVRPQPATPA